MHPPVAVRWTPPCYSPQQVHTILQNVLGLTPAVARVAQVLPEHDDLAGVAAALGISVHTAKIHCQRLSLVLGISSRGRLCAHIVASTWRHALAARAL